jgi:hypothetical protein
VYLLVLETSIKCFFYNIHEESNNKIEKLLTHAVKHRKNIDRNIIFSVAIVSEHATTINGWYVFLSFGMFVKQSCKNCLRNMPFIEVKLL